MTADSVDVTVWLTSLGYLTGTREERDARIAESWDAVAAYVKRSTNEQLRRDNPGIGDEGIARWRRQADHPPQRKLASDYFYAHTEATS